MIKARETCLTSRRLGIAKDTGAGTERHGLKMVAKVMNSGSWRVSKHRLEGWEPKVSLAM